MNYYIAREALAFGGFAETLSRIRKVQVAENAALSTLVLSEMAPAPLRRYLKCAVLAPKEKGSHHSILQVIIIFPHSTVIGLLCELLDPSNRQQGTKTLQRGLLQQKNGVFARIMCHFQRVHSVQTVFVRATLPSTPLYPLFAALTFPVPRF